MLSVSIVGVGRIGGSLAIALSGAGFTVKELVARRIEGLKGIAKLINPAPKLTVFGKETLQPVDVVLICTRDPEIREVSEKLAGEMSFRPVVLHTSGSLSSEVLAAFAEAGCPTGSMHPLVSISEAKRGAASYAGKYFCIEGDSNAAQAAKSLSSALGGRPFSISSDKKSLYHAAAIMASGNVAALFDAALEMMERCGVERKEARQILLPLLVSMVENLKIQEVGDALTGSFARGDFDAFERHWKSLLQSSDSGIRRIFLELGDRSITIAERSGGVTPGSRKLRKMINMAKAEREC